MYSRSHWNFVFASAPVREEGWTAPETPVLVNNNLNLCHWPTYKPTYIYTILNLYVKEWCWDVFYQCQAVGVSGLSGLPAQEPVVLNLWPAIGVAAVPSPKLEERPALEFRNCTMGLEFKSWDNPALSLFSVQVRKELLSSLKFMILTHVMHLQSPLLCSLPVLYWFTVKL